MNRAVRKLHERRCALKNTRGGGYAVGAPLSAQAYYVPEYKGYSDCYDQLRPGEIQTQANPALAQVAMAGGKRRNRTRRYGGGVPAVNSIYPPLVYGGSRCGCMRMRGGNCGCIRGGRRTRKQRGGRFSVDASQSVGGVGPVAAPVYSPVPCDPRAGTPHAIGIAGMSPDPRAPVDLYSVSSQSGGTYEGPDCYRAPGSQIPVYPAESAGFRFAPSTAAGAALPDGVTAYNEVVPYAARMGGAYRRKTYKKRRTTKKRKASKRSRRH